MSRRLPPLNQLRAFEAAARHLSFKDAADELNVTHAAVSQQIRALEDFLGSQLFRRVTRGVRLTDEARELSDDLTEALDQMDFAVKRFRASGMSGTLRISVVPWYGNRLILPKLADFRAEFPGLDIELGFSYEIVQFENSDYHAALRHGLGNWPNLFVQKVHNDSVSPLCAPELVAGSKLPLSPEQIARMDLAIGRGQQNAWTHWLKEAGLSEDIKINFIEFDNRALATEFALGGNGVCLPDLQAVQLELKSGQLLRLHPLAVSLESGLHLVFPKTPYPDPRILAFADWIEGILSPVDDPK
jgi:LysR family glycine cleavage system transcriptional activator